MSFHLAPQLTYLEWFVPPQTTAIAGEKFHTFSVTADEDLTDRVKLEEQCIQNENIIFLVDLISFDLFVFFSRE